MAPWTTFPTCAGPARRRWPTVALVCCTLGAMLLPAPHATAAFVNIFSKYDATHRYAGYQLTSTNLTPSRWEVQFRIYVLSTSPYPLQAVRSYPIALYNDGWGIYQGNGRWNFGGVTAGTFDGNLFQMLDPNWHFEYTAPDTNKAYPYVEVGDIAPGESRTVTWQWDWSPPYNTMVGYDFRGEGFGDTVTFGIPEPPTVTLAAAGLAVLLLIRRLRGHGEAA